jgi:dTDP-4-amino-4,6-dideoxygalactose transaminase
MKKEKSSLKVPNFKIVLSAKDREFILAKTAEVLKSNRWTSGPKGEAFELAFKKYVGAPYAISVCDGGAAIVAILQALHIPQNSIVICPTLTAPPTPHAILKAGMRVVFADSNPEDIGLDLKDVEEKLKQYKDKVKAVISVHVGGWISPHIKELNAFCKKYNIFLIEDCAHAHGSFLNGKHAGSFGKAAAYSFFMTKSLTSGEGGIVTSEDERLIDEIRIIRNYGKDEQGRHIINGFNYKFSEFNAAVALWACVNASRIIKERHRLAANYDYLLRDIEGISVFKVPECQSGYYKYIITVNRGINRDRFKRILLEKYGVETAGGVYDVLCHQEPYFKTIPDRVLNANEVFSAAQEFSRRQICLPLYLGLKESQQRYIARSIRLVLKRINNHEAR